MNDAADLSLPPNDLSFPILGRRLHVRGIPELHDWLRTYWHFPEHDVPPRPYTIRIDAADALLPLRDATTHSAGIPGLEMTWHHRDGVWQTNAGGATTRLMLAPAHAHITLANEAGATGAAAPAARAALYTALSEAVRASGLVPMHAAAIARDDDSTLLLGPSGTGKTTTLLRAVRAGWSPLAEDLVWLDPGSLRVHGWDRGVRLWPGTARDLVPDAPEGTWDVAADGKLFLPWQRLAAPRTPSARLTRIVLLERTGAEPTDPRRSRPTPLASAELVRVLWEATGVPLTDATRSSVAACVARLAHEVEHLRLRLHGQADELDALSIADPTVE